MNTITTGNGTKRVRATDGSVIKASAEPRKLNRLTNQQYDKLTTFMISLDEHRPLRERSYPEIARAATEGLCFKVTASNAEFVYKALQKKALNAGLSISAMIQRDKPWMAVVTKRTRYDVPNISNVPKQEQQLPTIKVPEAPAAQVVPPPKYNPTPMPSDFNNVTAILSRVQDALSSHSDTMTSICKRLSALEKAKEPQAAVSVNADTLCIKELRNALDCLSARVCALELPPPTDVSKLPDRVAALERSVEITSDRTLKLVNVLSDVSADLSEIG